MNKFSQSRVVSGLQLAGHYLIEGSLHYRTLLGGSWVAISRVISRVTILITHIRALITPHIATLKPNP